MIKIILLLLLAAPTSSQSKGLDSKLPDLKNLASYGCHIAGPIAMQDHGSPYTTTYDVWMVRFWAEHKEPGAKTAVRDWQITYSYRRKRKKGFADCEKFMERVKKARLEARK